jgi:hypothetical protein
MRSVSATSRLRFTTPDSGATRSGTAMSLALGRIKKGDKRKTEAQQATKQVRRIESETLARDHGLSTREAAECVLILCRDRREFGWAQIKLVDDMAPFLRVLEVCAKFFIRIQPLQNMSQCSL